MANTEGLPDEFVESLMTTTTTPSASARSKVESGGQSRTTVSSVSDRQRRRLQERMEMPLPQDSGPAARIVRPSPQSSRQDDDDVAKFAPHSSSPDEPQTSSPTYDQEESSFSFPMLGNVVERQPKNKSYRKSAFLSSSSSSSSRGVGGGKKPSRFAASQQQQALKGFPSVHVPLGSFCKSNSARDDTMTSNPGPRPVKSASNRPKRSMTAASGATSKSTSTTTNTNDNPKKKSDGTALTTDSMLEAAERDAEGMLQGMMPEEIKQQQQELRAALSPDMVAFLKRRRPSGKKGIPALENGNTTAVDETFTDTTDNVGSPSTGLSKRDTLQEKQRIAELMSKVQSHQDLDQAYQTIMKEPHPLEVEHADTPMGTGEDSKDDFALACDLLRSTNPRQTLWAARVVQQQLSLRVEQRQQAAKSDQVSPSRDWPVVLPVSLRCLLDQTVQPNTGYLLHTYCLQSLYSLLLLTAHSDHVVRVLPTVLPTPATIYADCYLDDAIPSPRHEVVYSATPVKPLASTSEEEDKDDKDTSNKDEKVDSNPATTTATTAAYATQSSSTSAQADGEAFDRDPMWTLLSKMEMVPRLAQLLTTTSTDHLRTLQDWPPEAWTSWIGILAMMAQRSPGAASAIAHHKVILPRLVARILPCLQDDDEEIKDQTTAATTTTSFVIAYAVFQLLVTLARQSRVTAQWLPLADLLPPLLARTPDNSVEFRVQQLGLQLWRSLLRYGCGLEALESMTTAAARHLALPYTQQYSLSIEFVSALTQVLECAKLAKSKGKEISDTFVEQANINNNGNKMSSVLSTLSMASTYLASTQRNVMLKATTTIDATISMDDAGEYLRYRWNAARLRFLSNYWTLGETGIEQESEAEEIKIEEWSLEQVLTCLEAMDEWTDRGGLVEKAWNKLAMYAAWTEWDYGIGESWTGEAAASAFLDGFVQLLLSLATSSYMEGDRMIQELARSVSKHFLERVLEGLGSAAHKPNPSFSGSSRPSASAQRGWIHQSHFAVTKVFSHCLMIGEQVPSSDLHLIRMMIFNLLGRLELGSEAMAAVLFSQDILFQANGNPLDNTDESSNLPAGVVSTSSPISSMFLGELCGSEQARKQLDHSFKLQHGFGVTKDGIGAFALGSLLSDAGCQPKPQSPEAAEMRLPIGKLWLWQTLSGQIRTKEEGAVARSFDEATSVVTAVLGLLMELEQGGDVMGASPALGYSARIPLGAKLYYLMNVCLHTEAVLREQRVLDLAEGLLERYWPELVSSSILDFSQACLEHTDLTKTKDKTTMEEKDKKLLALFNPEIPNEVSLSSDEMRSLEAFVDDMAEAYNDYGAQYDFFTKCIRLFLLPTFPSAIRCRALKALRATLHLLTLPAELERPEELRTLLHLSISGGSARDTARDPPELLNGLSGVMVPNSCPRPLTGFVLAVAVATITRNVVIALMLGEGVDTMKKRLIQFGANTCELVFKTVMRLNGMNGTKNELVDATLGSLKEAIDIPQGEDVSLQAQDLDERLGLVREKLCNHSNGQ